MDSLNHAGAGAAIGPMTFSGSLSTRMNSRDDFPATSRSKTIQLRTPAVARAYTARIARHLESLGHRVQIVACPDTKIPSTIDWLLYFERIAYRSLGTSFAPHETAEEPRARACDLVIDLSGSAPETDTPTIRLFFETGPGEAGLVTTLLSSRPLALNIVATRAHACPRMLRSARLGVESPQMLGTALDIVTPRLMTLLEQAIGDLDQDMPGRRYESDLPEPRPGEPLEFAITGLAQRIAKRLTNLLRQPDCWRIAIRVNDGLGVMERCDWSGPGWTVIPDDGKRFFADPFLFEWEGKSWLFCEEYPYATGKGILSVAPVDANGAVGAFRPFLETSGHLSWPQVFAHEGQIYMIPESASAGRIELWRATDFPHRWVLDRVLIEGVQAHDPVLHLSEKGAFMLATLTDDGGSSWDALGLFHAPDLFGSWRSHPHNPLMVDSRSVRGAGPIVRRGADLWRATQDCRAAYGDGLTLCRITQLDSEGYAHQVVTRLAPPAGLRASGTHSLSRAGNLEAIDLRGFGKLPTPRA